MEREVVRAGGASGRRRVGDVLQGRPWASPAWGGLPSLQTGGWRRAFRRPGVGSVSMGAVQRVMSDLAEAPAGQGQDVSSREGVSEADLAGGEGGGGGGGGGDDDDDSDASRRARSRDLRERYPNVKSARTDDEFEALVRRRKDERDADGRDDLVVVDFGAVWCEHCRGMLPAFLGLADAYPKHTFVVADVDRLPVAADSIRYTPTFSFYRRGRKVDEFFGGNSQKLQDRVWLHSQSIDASLQTEVEHLREQAKRAREREGGGGGGGAGGEGDDPPARPPRAPFARSPRAQPSA